MYANRFVDSYWFIYLCILFPSILLNSILFYHMLSIYVIISLSIILIYFY